MKKILVILLVFFYLGTTSGYTMHLHYCMGEMINLELSKSDSKNCNNCGMEKSQSTKNGCCKDELKKIQTDDSGQLLDNNLSVSIVSPTIATIPTHFKVNTNRFVAQVEEKPVGNDPPFCKLIPSYISNCTYRI